MFVYKVDNKLKLDKKGFDNLANKEQGEALKKEETENQNQEKATTDKETTSCEHQNERERLAKESMAEAEESQSNGITQSCQLICWRRGAIC